MSMEFWGVEVKPGVTVKCKPKKERYIHLSQASLGESKGKGNESVLISVKVDDKKLVLGTLSLEKSPHVYHDLVFEKDFELSHNSKSASVYFCGYKVGSPEKDFEGDDYTESESEEENVPAGKPLAKQEQGKLGSGKAKAARVNSSAAEKAEPAKVEKPKSEDKEDEEDSDESEDDSEEDSEDDEDMVKAMSDSDDEDEDDSSEEEDEATPKKTVTGKRPAESASKSPAPKKKATIVTPAKGQKTDKPLAKQEQGKLGGGKAKAARENSSAAKKVEPAKVEKPKSEDKEDEEDSDESEDDSEDDSEEDSDDDEDMVKAMSDSDDEDEDDSSEEEDEATPKKSATGKRPAESASKTPAPEKKATIVTPAKGQKTGDGKKVVHLATPYPFKKAGKTPAESSDKSKQQTLKSAGSVICKLCARNFNSQSALQAHTKFKHG